MSVRADYRIQSKTALLPSWLPIVWEEFITWRNKFWMYIVIYMLSPLIFLLSFGMGVGQRMKMMMPGGMSYLEFLVPGVVALALFNNGMTSVMTRMYYSRNISKALIPTGWHLSAIYQSGLVTPWAV